MKLVIDGVIYLLQPRGGISRLYTEILPRMCYMDESLRVSFLLNGKPVQELPYHLQIVCQSIPRVERFFRLDRLWKPFIPNAKGIMHSLYTGKTRGKIWHSTYYTMPAWWKGPKVVTVYDMIHEHFPNFFGKNGINFRKQKRHCMEDADAIISISQTTKEDLQTFYNINKNRIWVAPPACSDTFMKSGSIESSGINIMTQKPFLLYVGIRSHYKNTDFLIRAYSKWHHNKEIDLIVVGRPWTEKQITELVALGIKDKVHILGYVDDNTLAHLYCRAVAFVFPSLYEGFGIPLLEAMACGCPVVASKIPSTIEVAGECPVYFDPQDSDSMINAFEIALTEGRNSARVEKGFERIKHYSWDRAAQQTLEVYRSL